MSYRISISGLVATGVLGVILCTARAEAADLDGFSVPPPLQEQKVEFGSGWYIRGDIGAIKTPSLENTVPNLPTVDNQTPPNAPNLTLSGSSSIGYVGALGAGYQFNNWIRSDIDVDFQQPLSSASTSGNSNVFCPTGVSYPNGGTTPLYANGGCTGYYKGDIKRYDVLVNGYVDLGTWYKVTPYVGAGVGLSFGHYQTSATYLQSNGVPYQVSYTDPLFAATYYNNYDRHASGTYYGLAYAFMAGVAIDVFDHTKLDIGYRYRNLGSIPNVSGTLSSQEVRAGLRYMIDN